MSKTSITDSDDDSFTDFHADSSDSHTSPQPSPAANTGTSKEIHHQSHKVQKGEKRMKKRKRKIIVSVVSIALVIVTLYIAALATVFSLIDDEELQISHLLEIESQDTVTAVDVKDLPETCRNGNYTYPMPQLPEYARDGSPGWSFEANEPTVKKSIWIGSDISGLQWLKKQYESIYWITSELSQYSTDRLDLLSDGCFTGW